ncbi:phage regulatory protein, partial [Butyricicoccus sp. 1XD8-22]
MDLTIIHDGQAVTTSIKVAESFEKEHKHILRDINNLQKDVPNFGLMFF